MDYFTLAADVAQVVLAICAIFALWQLRLSKKQLENQKKEFNLISQRDARKVAVEEIRYYSTVIIPLFNKLDEKIKNENIVFFEKDFSLVNGKICPSDIKVKESDAKKIKNLLSELGDVTNRMEEFSIFFVSGLAEKEVAFDVMSDVFFSEVERLFPFYAITQNQVVPATLQLYKIWKDYKEERGSGDKKDR